MTQIMFTAERLAMTSSEYVYLNYDMLPRAENERPWPINGETEEDSKKHIYTVFKQVMFCVCAGFGVCVHKRERLMFK